MKYTGTSEGELPCIIIVKHEMLYVFYTTTTPYLPCNNNYRTELYDFYYTAITLTTGYKLGYTPHKYISTKIYTISQESPVFNNSVRTSLKTSLFLPPPPIDHTPWPSVERGRGIVIALARSDNLRTCLYMYVWRGRQSSNN